MEDITIDKDLVTFEACLVNGGVQIELCDSYTGEYIIMTLLPDEIRKVRDLMDTALGLEQ